MQTGHLESLEFSRWLADLWGRQRAKQGWYKKIFKRPRLVWQLEGQGQEVEIWGEKNETYSVKKDPIKCHKMIYLFGGLAQDYH